MFGKITCVSFLALFFSFMPLLHGRADRIVYPQAVVGTNGDHWSFMIDLRLGNDNPGQEWVGTIRLLRQTDLEGMVDVHFVDGEGEDTLAPNGEYRVVIPARGSSSYSITSELFQQGVLVIESFSSPVQDLSPFFLYRLYDQTTDSATDLIAIQPASTPARNFRSVIANTDSLAVGLAVVSERGISGGIGEAEVTLTAVLSDGTEWSGKTLLGQNADEQKALFPAALIDGLPPRFEVAQLSISASEPVYCSMLGVGTPPAFKDIQIAATPVLPSQMAVIESDLPSGQFQYQDLVIGFTPEFLQIWTDAGTGAQIDGSFWEPQVPTDLEGFYLVGDLAIRGYSASQNVIAVLKDAFGEGDCTDPATAPALCPPLEFERIWYDSGTGAATDVSLFWPKPTEGYRCLGLIASPSWADIPLSMELQDKRERYRCVREDLVVPAALTPEGYYEDGPRGQYIWNTWDSGADFVFGAWGMVAPGNAPSGEIYLAPGTFAGHSDFQPEIVPQPMALRFPIPEQPTELPVPLPPVLTDYSPPSPFSQEVETSVVKLPWFAVNDPYLTPIQRLEFSPEYTLSRTSRYKLIQWAYNRTEVQQSVQWEFNWGTYGSTSTEFSSQTGIEFEAGFKIPEVVDCSVTISQTFTYSQSSTSGWEESTTYTLPVEIPAGTVVAAYLIQSNFTLFRQDDSQVSVSVPYDLDTILFDQYPPAQEKPGN